MRGEIMGEAVNKKSSHHVLLKFVEKQFIESTLDGYFYFALSNYFIELEEETNKGIGDNKEGMWSIILSPENNAVLVSEDGKKIPINNAVLRKRYDMVKKLPICCFVILSLEDDFEKIPNENILKLKPEIDLSLRKQFKERNLLFFTDIYEAINRFDTACKNVGFYRLRGEVKYYDDTVESHPLKIDIYEEDPVQALLYKRKVFEEQKEFRIIIKNPQESPITLNVGDIRDIALDIGVVSEEQEIPFRFFYTPLEETIEE